MNRGTEVGRAYVKGHFDGSGMNEEIVDEVESAGPGVDRAGEEHGDRYGERFGKRFGERFTAIRERLSGALSERLGEVGERAGQSAGVKAGKALTERLDSTLRERASGIGDSFAERIGTTIAERLEETLAREFDRAEDLFDRIEARRRSGGDGVSGNRGPSLGDRIGGLFGAGSRSNFLNFVGSAIGNIINLSSRLQGVASSVFSTFKTGFTSAGENATLFQKLFAGATASASGFGGAISSAASTLVASGPAMVAAIAAVVLVLSAAVSVAGALLGIITALVSTIASGLVGALLVAGPLITGLVAGTGLLVAAFTSLTDAQSAALAADFQPLKAELTGIGQVVLENLIPYFGVWSSNLQNALLLIAPLAERMGDAFGRAGAIITESLSGPGFQALTQSLTQFLPNITTNLSRALGAFLNGVAGTFGALMPLVDRFARYLGDVATRFSNFANSAQGRNAIVDFANRAVDSLQSLWGATREIFGFIFDLIFNASAQRQGNGMFDTLTRSFKGFREAIKDGRLEKWLTDAREFGSDLYGVMGALGKLFEALYNSGILNAVGFLFQALGANIQTASFLIEPFIDFIGSGLPGALSGALGPLSSIVGALADMAAQTSILLNLLGRVPNSGISLDPRSSDQKTADLANLLLTPAGLSQSSLAAGLGAGAGLIGLGQNNTSSFNLPDLTSLGNAALNATSTDHGGYLKDPTKPKDPKKPPYKNPYVEFANSLMQQAPTARQTIRRAVRQLNRDTAQVIREAATASGADSVISALNDQAATLRSSGSSLVESAQNTLSSSAQRLANAGSKKEAKAALKEVQKDQRGLAEAQAQQQKLIDAAKILDAQQTVSANSVAQLVAGVIRGGATLAEIAQARQIVADKIQAANDALVAAIQLRTDYINEVASAGRVFGAIATAQAKVVDGVEQALTADDITDNLQARYDKIIAFRRNLQVLLSQGLSQDAYKQLVDMGVEDGTAYVDALVAGGQGSIGTLNDLVDKVNGAADDLGTEAGIRLYQAGVDAAAGLVDGLNSIANELDAAGVRLGETIAAAVRRSLGIASPSKVMIGEMEHVGDGLSLGLRNQSSKVSNAAEELSKSVAISPSLRASLDEGRVPEGVSGNGFDGRIRDLHIHTPTEDPRAVAVETLNELTGELP